MTPDPITEMSQDPSSSILIDPRSDQKVERPRMWRVLLHNDDYTTQEFVVWVLESVFRKPRAEAVEVMMHVHQSGIGVAGIYTHDVAETKLRKTRQMAEEQEFPLLVTMEPDAGSEHE
jgi:ATP-dependent Clp protease adaptor protein ClpS